MSWNYRIVHFIREDGEEYLALHEVYYNAAGEPNGLTKEPATFGGEEPLEICESLNRAIEAMIKPVLHYPEDFQNGLDAPEAAA